MAEQVITFQLNFFGYILSLQVRILYKYMNLLHHCLCAKQNILSAIKCEKWNIIKYKTNTFF